VTDSSQASLRMAGVVAEYCLAKPGAWPDQPWEGDTVAKVGPKIFAFLGSDGGSLGLKCGRDRDEADELLARYPGSVTAMAYLGRYGWNTFVLDGRVDVDDLLELIDASYESVVARLPRKHRPVGG
jgi:predicted DNA-binding protein (MmcQ/YjbR family)